MSGYFSSGPAGDEPLRVLRAAGLARFEVLEGIAIRPVLGARMNVNVVDLAPGAVAPAHAHPEEQIGYVVAGSCEFTDGERTWTLGPGDAYHAPAGAPHGARALEAGCTIVDCFAPARAEVRRLLEG